MGLKDKDGSVRNASQIEEFIKRFRVYAARDVHNSFLTQWGDELDRLDREVLQPAREALRDVPDPEREGHCESCGSRLDLVKIGKAYKFQHLPHCWYAKVVAALAKLDGEEGL